MIHKLWSEHSTQWQREALQDGLDPKRWNAWQKLSSESRAESDPRKYAQGTSIAQQRLERKQKLAVDRLLTLYAGKARRSAVTHDVALMSNSELNKVVTYDDHVLNAYLSRGASERVASGTHNPYWYH